MRVLIVSASVLIAMGAAATAGTRVAIVFNQGTNRCEKTTAELAGDRSTVEVSIVEGDPRTGAKAAPARTDITVRALDAAGTALTSATIKARSTQLDKPMTFAAGGDTTIVVAGKEPSSCSFIVAGAKAAPTPRTEEKPGRDDKPPPAPSPAVVEQARQYLSQRGILDHVRTGDPTGHTYKLYHLPDGSPAFPLPHKIAEEDQVELWIVTAAGDSASAEITTCKDVPAVRIIGTRPGKPHAPESGEPHKLVARPPAFGMSRVAAPVRCAELLSYRLRTTHGEREISIKIAPVHLFSWGLAYGFDFGRPTRLKLVERPVAGGMGETERVIVRENDRTGLRPMVTLTLNACKANLDDWDACDAVGLTAMADPGRLDEGGGIGLKLQPYPGLGVLIGVTFFQVDTLEPGHELGVGDVFRRAGDLPIDKEFRWQSLGLFLGAGGDTDTIKKLF